MAIIKRFVLFGSLSLAAITTSVSATGYDWSTGQGLVDTCNAIKIPRAKAKDEDVALVMMCVAQFKIWRDSWTFADTFNEQKYNRRGPICVPHLISNMTLIEGFLQWSKHGMSEELKSQQSTASTFAYMAAAYPCK